MRYFNHFFGQVFPLLVLGYLVFGINVSQLFVPRHASGLSEADFQILSKNYYKNQGATVESLESSFIECLPSTMDNRTAKYYAEIYSYIITRNVEFRSQPDLPEVGSTQRAEIEAKFKSDRKKSVDEKSNAMIAVMSSSQQTKLKEMDMTYSTVGQAVEWSNCAMTSALQKLPSKGT